MLRKLFTLAGLFRNLSLLPDLAAGVRRLEQLQLAQSDLLGSLSLLPSMATDLRRLDRVAQAWSIETTADPAPVLAGQHLRERIVTLATGQSGAFLPLDHAAVLQPRPASYTYEAVARRIEQDGAGIDAFLQKISPRLEAPPLDTVPDAQRDETGPYWGNGYFSGDDARLLVAYIGAFRPQVIMEIGSGNSTKFARLAVATYGTGSRIVSVDPEPRASIEGISDVLLRRSVLDIELTTFDQLGPGDLLFHDGSHLTLNGTDTVRLFLEILPRLRPGVVVHVHDIRLPREYPASFDGRGYSEQYMLAAALLFGDAWEVLAPVDHLHATGRLRHGGTSFWMRRRLDGTDTIVRAQKQS